MSNGHINADLDQWAPAYASGMAGAPAAAADNKQLVALGSPPSTGACGRECGACPSAGAGCSGARADQAGGTRNCDTYIFAGIWHARRVLKTGEIACGLGYTEIQAIADLESICDMHTKSEKLRMSEPTCIDGGVEA